MTYPVHEDGRGGGKGAPEGSVGALVKQGTEQLSELVRQELRLAQAELAAKGKRAALGGGLFGAAAVTALFGGGALVATAIAALPLSVWASALVVAAALFAVTALLVFAGRRQLTRATPPVPAEAVEGVRQDLETIKERAKR